ncbi:LPS export ABC transporter permease LptF [Coralliovum pocilloporae]|uniref:LPS export ABC transporter permease LptF n=1 Tax=Coralliovum pocilloporae TaxID=3066369 RepID=UPI0033074255
MSLIERYIFKRAFGAFLLCLTALTGLVWVTQALREFDLITSKGQTILIFIQITSLLIPVLLIVTMPFALVIAAIYTLNTLSTDSELIVINANGGSPKTVAKPLITLGIICTIFGLVLSLWLAPLSLRNLRDSVTQVQADLIASIVKPGNFRTLDDGLTFHIRDREANGTMRGIFVSDKRDKEFGFVYLADKGQVIEAPQGTYLVMQDGNIQRINQQNGEISIVKFESYAFDLSQFTNVETSSTYKPREQPVTYLLSPDPDDAYFQRYPERYVIELHDRLSGPWYNLAFVMVALAFLGSPQSIRQGRMTAIVMVIAGVVAVRLGGFLGAGLAKTTTYGFLGMYLSPALGVFLPVFLITGGRKPKILSWSEQKLYLSLDTIKAHAARLTKAHDPVEGRQ